MGATRTLVVHPPARIAADFIDQPWHADLGAVQLAAVLAREGDVVLVDACALPDSGLAWREDGRAHVGAPVAQVLEAVRQAGGSFTACAVAFTPFHRPPFRDEVLAELLVALRAHLGDTPLVLADCYQSGQHYIEAPDGAVLAAYPEADAHVKYEAEVAVPALVRACARGERPRGTVRGGSPALDALPAPAWHLVDLPARDRFCARVVENLGRGDWPFPIDGRTLPVVTSRGCPYPCIHCTSNPGRAPGEPKVQRRPSPERLRALLRTLVRAHGATRLSVQDELLNLDRAHFDTVLDEAAALDVRFDVPNGLRADRLEPADFERMRGRVATASVSAESGVQRVVDEVVGKKLDLASVERAAESAQRAGVPLLVHFIIGLPGESAADVNRTLAFAAGLHDRFGARPALQYAAPLPGTGLARGCDPAPVEDWGPRFQQVPSQPGAAIAPEVLQRFKETFERRLAATAGPRKLVLNLTYECNNHCAFCATGNRTRIRGHGANLREHLLRYREAGAQLVDFDGGEPTLHPELLALVRFARQAGYRRVHVTTNGRLCFYEGFARRLVLSGLDSLLFSLHGPDPATHAAQTGVPESFEQTVGGIRHCVRHAPSRVELGVNTTVTRSNCEHLADLAQLVCDLGLGWLNLQFLTPFGRATAALAPDPAVAAREAARVIDRFAPRLRVQVINAPFCLMPGYEPHLAGDLLKAERHMVFCNDERVNLGAYLAQRRVRRPECEPCPHAVFCGGFYALSDAPEPPWLGGPAPQPSDRGQGAAGQLTGLPGAR